jgi:multiple sugar transport system permease protein
MASLILVSVWQFFPFVVLGVLARLQSIPMSLYEAAAIDERTRCSASFTSRCRN